MRDRVLVLVVVLLGASVTAGANGEDAPSGSSPLSTAQAYHALVDAVEVRLPAAVAEGDRDTALAEVEEARVLLHRYLVGAVHPENLVTLRDALNATEARLLDGEGEEAVVHAAPVSGLLQAGAWQRFMPSFEAGSDREYRALNVLEAGLRAEGWPDAIPAYRAWRLDKENATLHALVHGGSNATGFTGTYWRAAVASAALGTPRAAPLAASLGTAPEPAALHEALAASVGARNASAVAVEAAIAHPVAVHGLLALAENRSADLAAADPAIAGAFEAAWRAVEAGVEVREALADLSAGLREANATALRPLPVLHFEADVPRLEAGEAFVPLRLHGLRGQEATLVLHVRATPAELPVRGLRVPDGIGDTPTRTSQGNFWLDLPAGAPDPLPLELVVAPLPGEATLSFTGSAAQLADERVAPITAPRVQVAGSGAEAPGHAEPSGDSRAETPGLPAAGLLALAVAAASRRPVND